MDEQTNMGAALGSAILAALLTWALSERTPAVSLAWWLACRWSCWAAWAQGLRCAWHAWRRARVLRRLARRPSSGLAADRVSCGWFDSSLTLRDGLAVQECSGVAVG